MGKPLLTDEMIARYNRGEALEDILADQEARTGQTIHISESEIARMVKSRRIENAKHGAFQSKLNRILLVIALLALLLLYAIFNW